jgi:DNA invertase Pin-like site-specific DNA recombinase
MVTMTSRSEPAGVWVRVSTGGQDEANQVPDIEQHCAAHGYSVTRRYELNDKSASKGEQQTKLDEMLADMRDSTIKVLVCWHSDRLERRGPEYVFRLLAQARDAGGRIESTKEPLFGAQDMSGEAMTALGAVISHQYSVHLGEQVKLAHDRIRANGGVGPGGTPWGYEVEGPKYQKELVPTDLCREYAPQIFARCIVGDSCRTIAAWLDVERVPPKRGAKWHEGSVRKLIHNRVYAGRWQDEARTETIAHCEPVVSADVWDRANAALMRRPHRGPVNKDNRPMLASLKCARCEDSPMFRIRLKSRSGKYYYYYRCAGRGAQRKGCGNMVPYEVTEAIVAVRVFMTSTEPYKIRHWVEGTSWDAEISDVKQDIREAADAERFDELPALQARLAELRSRESVSGHYQDEDTGITVGDHFDGLNAEGKREYLKTRDIRAGKATLTLEQGARRGIRVVIDGEDHGVFPYAPARVIR